MDNYLNDEHDPEPVVLVHDVLEHIEALWVDSSAVEHVEEVCPNENVEDNSVVLCLITRATSVSAIISAVGASRWVKVVSALVVKAVEGLSKNNEESTE